MHGSTRKQNRSNKNKNNKILKRMKELSNYYRRKLFRGGALDEAQVARMAELDAKKTTGLSVEEQTEYDSLIAMRDQPAPQVEAPQVEAPQPEVATPEVATPEVTTPEVTTPEVTSDGASLLEQAGNAVESVVDNVKGAVGLEGGRRRRQSNKKNNKRRNSKRQSQRKRR
jgi:hypothetical protein